MNGFRYFVIGTLVVAALGVCALETGTVKAAPNYGLLYSFGPRTLGACDGENPYGGLVMDAAGNLYGTTSAGGDSCFSYGTVFQLAPTGDGAWRETILHVFGSPGDGAEPAASMIFDNAGNLFGTTTWGGQYDYGTVFELSPRNGGVRETVLYNFTGKSDGANPISSLVSDSAGNLYGTTETGGEYENCPVVRTSGCGTVFELMRQSNGTWMENVLHQFTGGTDGSLPRAGLILDNSGNLYGTAAFGGTGVCGTSIVGCGTVFEMTPGSNGTWSFNVLHEFTGGDDGADPFGGLTLDPIGNVYGTTSTGGAYGFPGLVFELIPTASGWQEKVLHAFSGGTDGSNPFYETLVFDSAGNLYGTTEAGGAHRYGVLFELVPSSAGGWQEKVLHGFGGTGDGENPYSGVILDSQGNIYGTTLNGGFIPHDGQAYGAVYAHAAEDSSR